MRKQYHLWPAGTGFDAWDVDRLISLARGLPVHAVTVESVCEVDTVYWFDGSTTAPTVRAIVKHARLMLDADLSFPVILGPDGRVMDGMHRIARVMLEGRTEVSAVRFLTLPEPDHRTASPPISILTSIPELTEHSAVSASSARPAARDAAARPRRSARGGPPARRRPAAAREGSFGFAVRRRPLAGVGAMAAGRWVQGLAPRWGRTRGMMVICVRGAVSAFVGGPPRPCRKRIWTLSQYVPGGRA